MAVTCIYLHSPRSQYGPWQISATGWFTGMHGSSPSSVGKPVFLAQKLHVPLGWSQHIQVLSWLPWQHGTNPLLAVLLAVEIAVSLSLGKLHVHVAIMSTH